MSDKPASKQEQAINEYLQSLLHEVAEESEADVTASAAQIQAEVIAPETTHQEAEPTVTKPVIGLEKLVAEIPEVITEVTTKVELGTVEAELDEAVVDSGVPDWAQQRFQCLLFKVSGLTLAVPLVKLNSVIPWDENITETPNQTDWYLGLVQHLQNQVKIIDTALLVMPENRRDNIRDDPSERLGHILLVDEYKWGLACDSIGDVIWLTKEEVKWRKDKSTRAWLSGTSLEHLCAIMDTEVFAQMLNEAS